MSRKKTNQLLENVLIEDYAAEGKSIARLEGKVVFVENTVPGDVVDVRLLKDKKDWAEGYPVQFKVYSSERIAAFCDHFGICGGCQWQTLPYPLQLKYKQQQVEETLKRIGKVPLPEIQPIVGSEHTTAYRNKIEYTFSSKRFLLSRARPETDLGDQSSEEELDAVGFHARRMFDKVVEIDKCYLQSAPSNEIRNFIAQYGRELGLPFYNFRQHTGYFRGLLIRMALTGEILVNIIVAEKRPDVEKDLMDKLLVKFPEVTTWLFTLNEKMNDSLYDLSPEVYKGSGYITEQLGSFKFKISSNSFFQTNTRQAEKLYGVVREFAGLTGREIVYDLYCGTGSIGIFLSGEAKKVIGVELVESAISDARQNAALNGILTAEFFCGDVVKICNDAFFLSHGTPDVIITDPPRAGMHEKLVQKLLDIASPRIVYVSCNPATQARDLSLLGVKYHVKAIKPVDMFPHTLHIECVVLLERKY